MIYNGDEGCLTDLPDVVDKTVAAFRMSHRLYDSIVVRGLSGVVVGAPAALALEVPLVMVRKPKDEEPNHDYHMVINLEHAGERTIFLDDFRSAGATEREVERTLDAESEKRNLPRPELTACYFYRVQYGEVNPDGWHKPQRRRDPLPDDIQRIQQRVDEFKREMAFCTPQYVPAFTGLTS